MIWHRKIFKLKPTYFADFPFSDGPLLEEVDEPTSPSFDEWMAMIQGIETWLEEVSAPPFDPTGTIPGWKIAIFKDANGKPYWRSDGKPLTDPQPEDLSLKNKA